MLDTKFQNNIADVNDSKLFIDVNYNEHVILGHAMHTHIYIIVHK